MCLIVDANVCSVLFKQTKDTAYEKLRSVIFSNRITLVHGGKLTEEYHKAGVLNVIALLAQSGRAFKVSNELIDRQLMEIADSCESNDSHIIALARADRLQARVLVTNDQALQRDFKNKSLIDNPRGTIYSPSRHPKSLQNC
jgi:predicted nucleic acid-binding protein